MKSEPLKMLIFYGKGSVHGFDVTIPLEEETFGVSKG